MALEWQFPYFQIFRSSELMEKCQVCEREEKTFVCGYCDKNFCSEHREPENHDCEALKDLHIWDQDQRQFVPLDNKVPLDIKHSHFNDLGDIKTFISKDYSTALMAICILSFFLQLLLPFRLYENYLILNPSLLFSRPWTIVTHIFLHGGIGHLFFNMLFLYFFGPALERRVGSNTFLKIFFFSGIFAGLGHALTSPFPVLGASGALYGVFACLAILEPNLMIYVYFIPMRIKYALILFAALDFLMIGTPDTIAHVAHLSGLIVGLIYGQKLRKRAY